MIVLAPAALPSKQLAQVGPFEFTNAQDLGSRLKARTRFSFPCGGFKGAGSFQVSGW